jgi:hypothetical protein
MTNFVLKFGKHKGQNFNNTPKSYQDWLLKQDWFKLPTSNDVKYNVVKKFTTEYKMGMGMSKEIVLYNLTWDEANILKDSMNLYQLDETVDCYYIETSIY